MTSKIGAYIKKAVELKNQELLIYYLEKWRCNGGTCSSCTIKCDYKNSKLKRLFSLAYNLRYDWLWLGVEKLIDEMDKQGVL